MKPNIEASGNQVAEASVEGSALEAFRLRNHTFAGGGIQDDFQDAGWSELLEVIYDGRGGCPPTLKTAQSTTL